MYASPTRRYADTEYVEGRHIGNLTRLSAAWATSPRLRLKLSLEHMEAGALLHRAGFSSGYYGYLEATYRY